MQVVVLPLLDILGTTAAGAGHDLGNNRKTDRQAGRQTDGQGERQRDRVASIQVCIDRQIYRHTNSTKH